MSRRWWKRLAGCIVIELALAARGPAGLAAADFEYQAGTAAFGQAKALVLEDRHGNRAAIAQAEFAVTRPISDFAAVQVMRDYDLGRERVIVRGAVSGSGRTQDVTTALAAALGRLEPAVLRLTAGSLSVTGADGKCRASISRDGSLEFDGCIGGELVRAPIRAAFQVVEPQHGLQHRGETPAAYPIQAIAFGRQAAILALGGEVPAGRFRSARVIVAPFSNDAAPYPDDARVEKAILALLSRVGFPRLGK